MKYHRWYLLEKALRVVDSCKTLEQLEVARSYYIRTKWYSTRQIKDYRIGLKNIRAFMDNQDFIDTVEERIWKQIRLNAM